MKYEAIRISCLVKNGLNVHSTPIRSHSKFKSLRAVCFITNTKMAIIIGSIIYKFDIFCFEIWMKIHCTIIYRTKNRYGPHKKWDSIQIFKDIWICNVYADNTFQFISSWRNLWMSSLLSPSRLNTYSGDQIHQEFLKNTRIVFNIFKFLLFKYKKNKMKKELEPCWKLSCNIVWYKSSNKQPLCISAVAIYQFYWLFISYLPYLRNAITL